MIFFRFKFVAALIAISGGIFISEGATLACASCGSGGDEPLVLFPAEAIKIHGSVSLTPELESTGPDGATLQSTGPDRRVNSTFAVGLAWSPRGFFTVAQSLTTNSRAVAVADPAASGRASRSGAGDPSFSGRYTVLMPQLSRPLMPQIQLLAGYRPAIARSIHDSSDAHLLDVFGSGFDEIRAGIDLWLGMLSVKPGVAVTATESLATRHNGTLLKPGTLIRWTASLSAIAPTGDFGIGAQPVKLTTGITSDRRGAASADHEIVQNSEQAVNGAFISAEISAWESDGIKLALAQQGVFGVVKNSVASQNWSVAWSRVLR